MCHAQIQQKWDADCGRSKWIKTLYKPKKFQTFSAGEKALVGRLGVMLIDGSNTGLGIPVE